MKRLTLARVFEKLSALISSDIIYLLLFVIFLLLALYLVFSRKINKKEKRVIKVIYAVILAGLVIYYSSSLLSFLDYLVNKIFILIYFPNLATYVVMILSATVIFLVSLFKKNINVTVRNINISIYLLLIYFLFLLGQVVISKKINVYSDLAIYQNENMMVLIEITMIIFTLWVLGLSIYKLFSLYINRSKKKEVKEEFVEVSNQTNDEILIDGFTKEEYRLLSKYLKEIKEKQTK